MVDWTGTISTSVTWADGDRVTGNVTVGNSGTVTVNAGATITVTGNFSIIVTGTGKFVATGTATNRIMFKSSLADPLVTSWQYLYFNSPTSTGNSVQYCDFKHVAGGSTAVYLTMGTGSSITFAYNRFLDCGGVRPYSLNKINLTIANCYFNCPDQVGLNGAVFIDDSDVGANTITIQDCEFDNTGNGIYFGRTQPIVTIQRCLFRNTNNIGIVVDFAATITVTKNCIYNNGTSDAISAWGIKVNSGSATPLITVSNNIIGSTKKKCTNLPIYCPAGQGVTCSGNDLIGGTNNTAGTGLLIIPITNGSTSNNDYIAGNNSAGIDNADTSNSTSSTETPQQYSGLTSARTNARSTPNFPLTIDTVSAVTTSDGATITWNSNRPMNSEIYVSKTTGVNPDTPSTYDACYIKDDDWANISGRGGYKDKVGGQIGTAHSVTIAGLKAGTTYYYVVRGVDPANDSVASSQASFTTSGTSVTVTGASFSTTSITTVGSTTVTATVTNAGSNSVVCTINGHSFAMSNTTGNTYSTGPMLGSAIGTGSTLTGTVIAASSGTGDSATTSNTLTVTLASTLGIVTADFTQLINDFARTVSYQVVTRTNDAITGEETLSFAAGINKSWVFLKQAQRWIMTKEGIHELGDAYVIVPPSDSINRKDRLVVDGETYEVFNVFKRYIEAVGMYQYCVLYKIQGSQG